MVAKIDLSNLNEVYCGRPFGALAAAGFRSTYKAAKKAVEYEQKDPVVAAELYRHVVEGLVEDAYEIIGGDTDGRLGADIQDLADYLPQKLLPTDVVANLKFMKTLSSHDYVHFERSSRKGHYHRDPVLDCVRLRKAGEEVADWLVTFKDEYPGWRDEQTRKAEEQEAFNKKLGWWVGGMTLVGGVALFITKLLTGPEE